MQVHKVTSVMLDAGLCRTLVYLWSVGVLWCFSDLLGKKTVIGIKYNFVELYSQYLFCTYKDN